MRALKLALLTLAVLAVPGAARALTVADVLSLSRAGLPDVILTALIDADRTIFTLSPEQVLELEAAGVSEGVLLKMIDSRREFAPPPGPAVDPGPPPAAADAALVETAPLPIVTTVAVPYYVPVPVFIESPGPDRHRGRSHRAARPRGRALPPGTIMNGEFVR